MGDKKKKRKQMERLAEIAQELEERELAISRETKYLEKLKAELDERERSVAALNAAPAPALPVQNTEASEPVRLEKPVSAPQPVKQPKTPAAPPPVQPSPAAPAEPAENPVPPTAKMVAEINGILKSVFWDYSNNVHHISSQISTVTAAMMCAAVTCMLENRGFDAKDVFVQEIQKILKDGELEKAGIIQHADNDIPKPKHVLKPVIPQSAPKPAPEPISAARYLDADDEDGEAAAPAVSPPAKPRQTGDDILRIDSVIDFQKLGEYGFRNNEEIVRVALPEGIQYIPGNFFYGCSNLEEIWLPDSLLEIGSYSFYGCKSLSAVHMSERSALREIGEYAFALCEALPDFTVPPRVETLGTSTFRFCSKLERLHFSKESKLQFIGSHLLQNCTSLNKVRLPDSITVIPTSMFYGCLKLRKVVAKGVHTIEDYAFYGNESLRTVSISSKKSIAPQAFEGCDPALVVEYLNY